MKVLKELILPFDFYLKSPFIHFTGAISGAENKDCLLSKLQVITHRVQPHQIPGVKKLLKLPFTTFFFFFFKAGNMTNFRGGLLANLFLASISETNRC